MRGPDGESQDTGPIGARRTSDLEQPGRGLAPGFVTDIVRFALWIAGMNLVLIGVPCEHAACFGIGWGIRASDHAVR
jgi:hypothetical protein